MPVAHINGISINYVESGEGEALVLVHNLISSLHGYDLNMPAFAKHYRTIAYDCRGHGESSKPASTSDYTFDKMAEDLYQLLKSLNVQSAYFLGQAAIGIGQIFTFFLHHPEMVKGLIAVSFGALATGVDPARQRQTADMPRGSGGLDRLKRIAEAQGMMAALEERKKTLTLWTPEILDNPEIMRRFEVMYRQAAVPAFVALPERITEERRTEIAAQLQKHPVPVFQVAGADDVNPIEGLAGLRAISPRYHAVILPACGHYIAIENPDDFNAAVLNFLAGVRTYG